MLGTSMMFGRLKSTAVYHLPEIALILGIGSGAAAVGFGIRGGIKANDILKEYHQNLDNIDAALDLVHNGFKSEEEYNEAQAEEDRKIANRDKNVALAKAFAPVAGFGALSTACLIGGHAKLRASYTSLMGTMAVMSADYAAYRKRVKEKYGEEADKDLLTGEKQRLMITDQLEDGNSIEAEEDVRVFKGDLEGFSPWAFEFNKATCPGMWCPSHPINLATIRGIEEGINRKFRADGYIFLNDIREAFLLPKTSYGQEVGRIYEPGMYIDFSLTDGVRSDPGAAYDSPIYNRSIIIEPEGMEYILNKLDLLNLNGPSIFDKRTPVEVK